MWTYTIQSISHFILRESEEQYNRQQEQFGMDFMLFAQNLRMLRLLDQPLTPEEKNSFRNKLENLLSFHDTILKQSQEEKPLEP